MLAAVADDSTRTVPVCAQDSDRGAADCRCSSLYTLAAAMPMMLISAMRC